MSQKTQQNNKLEEKYLLWWNIISSNQYHPCKPQVVVFVNHTLDEQVWFTAMVDEPGYITTLSSIDAEWYILIFNVYRSTSGHHKQFIIF